MKLKHVHYERLEPGTTRKQAYLASMARIDTVAGGMEAVAEAKHVPDGDEIVSHIYSRSTGKPCPIWEAWECPECGQAHLGQERALACCRETGEE